MKKYIAGLALLAAASVYADDDSVYSANIVGFTKMTMERGGLTIVGIPFDNGTNQTPSEVFGDQLPVGSKLYVYDSVLASYSVEEYAEVSDGGTPMAPTYVTNWTPDTATVSAGEGVWVDVADDAPADTYDVLISGDVAVTADDVSVVEGLNLLAYPYPTDIVWTNTALAQSAVVGDKVYAWDGSSYEINEYEVSSDGGTPMSPNYVTNWTDPEMVLDISKGFWYSTDQDIDTVVSEPLPYEL